MDELMVITNSDTCLDNNLSNHQQSELKKRNQDEIENVPSDIIPVSLFSMETHSKNFLFELFQWINYEMLKKNSDTKK